MNGFIKTLSCKDEDLPTLIILIIIGYYDNKNKSAANFWGWTHFQGTINDMIILKLQLQKFSSSL